MKMLTRLLPSQRPAARSSLALLLMAIVGSGAFVAWANSPAPSEPPAAGRIAALVEAAGYQGTDAEALKKGLFTAVPLGKQNGETVGHVPEETIALQVKKSPQDFSGSLGFVFKVTDCLDETVQEFKRGKEFQGIPAEDRTVVSAYLDSVVEQYRARALETLFQEHQRPVTVPDSVPRSIDNAEYRQLLVLAAKALNTASAVAATTPAPAKEVAGTKTEVVSTKTEAVNTSVTETTTTTEIVKVTEAPATPEPAQAPQTASVAVQPAAAPVAKAPEPKTQEPAERFHVLQVGDSIAYLGRIYGVEAQDILDANPGLFPIGLREGRKVLIPSKSTPRVDRLAEVKSAPQTAAK